LPTLLDLNYSPRFQDALPARPTPVRNRIFT
jgi:hypothetical protein